MSDLKKYVGRRKSIDREFGDSYEEGYQTLKSEVQLCHTRAAKGNSKAFLDAMSKVPDVEPDREGRL